MPRFDVRIDRTVTTTVAVEAENAGAAVALVDRRDFPLPEWSSWDRLGEEYLVFDEHGNEIED